MYFNLLLPLRALKHYDRWIGDGHLTDVARLAEDGGFAGVSMTDHPFPDDDWLSQGGHHSFDPFVALSFMAAVTSRAQLRHLRPRQRLSASVPHSQGAGEP